MNISVQNVKINNCSYIEEKDYCLKGYHKLFIDENRLKVMRVDYGITSILSFKIDVPLSNESI